jgi:hypothetical protein
MVHPAEAYSPQITEFLAAEAHALREWEEPRLRMLKKINILDKVAFFGYPRSRLFDNSMGPVATGRPGRKNINRTNG